MVAKSKGYVICMTYPLLLFSCKFLAEFVDHEAGAEFGLKPSGLWGHDVAGVGNIDNLFHAHGIEGECHFHLTVVHAAFQLAETADAAYEVDTLVGAEVFDAENLVEHEVAEDGDVEHTNGVAVVVGAGLGGHLVPVAVKVHGVLVQLGGFVDLCAHVHYVVVLAHGGDELLFGETVKVFHYAVVVDDVELVVREDDGHEVVVLLLAGVLGVLLFLLLTHEGGGGATVVAVGNIHGGDFLVEELNEFGYGGLVVDNPEAVPKAIFLGDEVIDGFLGGDAGNDLVDAGHGGVGEENGFHVGIGYTHVFHAVFLFVLAGELVFLDDFVHVVLTVCAGHNAVLPFGVGIGGVHALGIYVELLLLVLDKPAKVFEQVVVLHHLEVDLGRMFVGAFGQVYLGFGNVKKAVGVALAFNASLFGIQHVVGTRSQFLDNVDGRPKALERFDYAHDFGC